MRKFFLLVFIFLQFTYLNVFADELLPIDAVLVLDVSRSMRTADPERVSRGAMNLFIDMLEENRDRVGVIAYAGEVERVQPLMEIPDCREILREFINSLEYASWTDHGRGLQEAVQMLELASKDEPRQGIIIFLTDGDMNVNPHDERTNEHAQADVYDAIGRAIEMNVPIHTIGLNFDGNLRPVDFIAAATNGLAFETANADDIPGIISAFFREMTAAPRVEIPEPEIYESPEIEPPDEEPPPEPEPTYVSENIFAVVAVGLFLTAGSLIFARLAGRKRVFTGKLILETADGKKREIDLIGYGRRVCLGELLENPAFDCVIFTPSPTAPSHLPQLQIMCKNPAVRFTQNFIAREIHGGISIAPGTEASISADETQVFLKYLAA